MNEYMFGCGHGHLPKRADNIAAKHGASLCNYTDAGCDCGNIDSHHGRKCPALKRHWFAGPRRGEPFDGRMERAVLADLVASGILVEDPADA